MHSIKRDLGHIKKGDEKNKSQEQKNTINNIKNLYNSREEVVRMFNDYAKIVNSSWINKRRQ